MRNFVLIILALGITVCINGCSKKEQPLEQMQQPMAPEDLSRLATSAQMQPAETIPAQGQQMPAPAATPAKPMVPPSAPEMKLEQLPPPGPYKPAAQEIQTALNNAGYDVGLVDGKIGPRTKKAIVAFQNANGLKADGKVGPKTWSLLSRYLNQAAESSAPQP